MIITVDGLSGAGKGTLASMLAGRFMLPFLETGLMWRKLAVYVDTNAVDHENEDSVYEALLAMPNIEYPDSSLRTEYISSLASIISGYANARALMDKKMETWARGAGGAVLDGRDCGRTMLPDADHKFFLVCDTTVRAQRRAAAIGHNVHNVKAGLMDRDVREINREIAPSVPAADAIVIDTTSMDIGEVMEVVSYLIQSKSQWNQLLRDAKF